MTRDTFATLDLPWGDPDLGAELEITVRGLVDLDSEDIETTIVTEIHGTPFSVAFDEMLDRQQDRVLDALWSAAEAQESAELRARAAELAADHRREMLLDLCLSLARVQWVTR